MKGRIKLSFCIILILINWNTYSTPINNCPITPPIPCTSNFLEPDNITLRLQVNFKNSSDDTKLYVINYCKQACLVIDKFTNITPQKFKPATLYFVLYQNNRIKDIKPIKINDNETLYFDISNKLEYKQLN